MVAEMTHNRRRVLGAAAATLAAGGLVLAGSAELRSSTPLQENIRCQTDVLEGTPSRLRNLVRSIVHHLPGDAGELPVEGHLPSFTGATGWLNSEPLTPEGLRGRVVLVDFWTYTCVNWLRTLPYVRAWDAKYAAQGLTTIGVHTPEFDFEHDVDNIIAQARALRVPYPIAVDSDYGVWKDLRQPLLAGCLHRRCPGPDPLPPLRRGRVRDAGDGHPAAPARGRRGGRGPGSGLRRPGGARSGGRLPDPALPGDLPGVRPGDRDGLAGRPPGR